MLAAAPDAHRLADHFPRVDLVILDELCDLPVSISGGQTRSCRAATSQFGADGLRTAPSHGPGGWEAVRAALCWFEGVVASFKEPLSGAPDETSSRRSERPPSNADEVIEMRRREFITIFAGAAGMWPLDARAQQPAIPVIGFLSGGAPNAYSGRVAGFRKGLNDSGYIDGHDVAIEFRWAHGQYDRLPVFAAELVQQKVAAIVSSGGDVAALAAKAATSSIPIVIVTGSDPVKAGLVTSFNRPGGNVTGASFVATELETKRLEILRDVVPTAAVIGVLVNPTNPAAESRSKDLEIATRTLERNIHIVNASSESDLETAFATLVEQRAAALLVSTDSFFTSQRDRLVALAARHALPTIYAWREFVEAGGLVSYGPIINEVYRQAGVYTGRILKGEKPADLPFVRPTKFELVINLKTATALGLTIPPLTLGRADEVIE